MKDMFSPGEMNIYPGLLTGPGSVRVLRVAR
jgi:hypothetical protein